MTRSLSVNREFLLGMMRIRSRRPGWMGLAWLLGLWGLASAWAGPATGDRGMVATVHPLATRAGIDALQAALLRVKLPELEGWTARRRENAARYDAAFNAAALDEGLLRTPARRFEGHVYNQYVIRTSRRDELQAHLGAENDVHPTDVHPEREQGQDRELTVSRISAEPKILLHQEVRQL